MKRIFLPIGFFLFVLCDSDAALPVIDAAQIVANRAAARLDYAQQVLHEINQQTQIVHAVQQIAQADDYLRRMGDPEKVFDLGGIDSLFDSLESGVFNQSSEELMEAITGVEAFAKDRLSVYEAVGASIEADAEIVAERSAEQYKPEEAAHRSVEQYRKVRAEALENRKRLRGALARAITQLRSAATASEVHKLTGILIGLQTELAANDSDIEIATAEVMARMLENQNRKEIERKAEIENGRVSLRTGHQKDAGFYQLLNHPSYFNR